MDFHPDPTVDRAVRSMAARYSDADSERDDLLHLGRVAAWRVVRDDPDATPKLAIHAAKMAMYKERRRSLAWLAGKASAAVRPRSGRAFMDWREASDFWADVRAALNDADYAAVKLRHRWSMSAAEAAVVVGCSRAAMDARCRSAVAKLKTALESSYGDEYGGPSKPLRRPEAWRCRARRSSAPHGPGKHKAGRWRASGEAKIRVIEDSRRLAEGG